LPTLGVLGIFINRKNIIVILMSVELILLAVNINLVASTAIEPRLRKNTTRIARPIAASAAATVRTNRAKTCPILFTLGVLGIFINRKNIIVILMSVELILLAVNINLARRLPAREAAHSCRCPSARAGPPAPGRPLRPRRPGASGSRSPA
jgi:NADH:ubiquinone oxidoreductase subunit K